MASVGRRILSVIFIGENRLTPTINQVRGGLTQVAQAGEQVNRTIGGQGGVTSQLTQLDRVQRAWATSARYYIAGYGLYKITQAISNTKDYQATLGQLNTTLMTSNDQLDKFGQMAMKISTRTATPLQDVLQSIQNIARSLPGASRQLIGAIALVEAQGARVVGTDPYSFGATVTQLGTSFYGRGRILGKGGPGLIRGIANQVVQVALTTPRVTGEELAQYLPRLGRAAGIGGFSLPQALALFELQMRAGGTVTTNVQWLSQLMYRIRNPRPQAQPFYAQAGLTKESLSNMTGMQALRQLLQFGLSLPGASHVTPQQFNQMMRSGSLGKVPITGQAQQFFQATIGGRQQSLAAFIAIAQQFPQIQKLTDQLIKSGKVDELNKKMSLLLDRQRMQQAAIAFSNMMTSMLSSLMPFANIISRMTTWTSSLVINFQGIVQHMNRLANRGIDAVFGGHFAARHHLAGNVELGAALGIGSAAILGRLGAFSRFGRLITQSPKDNLFSRFRGGPSKAIAALTDPGAITSAMAGVATGTAEQPFWVVIHPYSRQTVPELFKGGIGGAGTAARGGGGLGSLFSKIRDLGLGSGGIATAARAAGALGLGLTEATGIGALVTGGAIIGYELYKNRGQRPALHQGSVHTIAGQRFRLNYERGGPRWIPVGPAATDRHLQATGMQAGSGIWPGMEGAFAGVNSFVRALNTSVNNRGLFLSNPKGRVGAHGTADVTIGLIPQQGLEKIIKQVEVAVHVPVSLWDVGTAPTSRGKPTTSPRR